MQIGAWSVGAVRLSSLLEPRVLLTTLKALKKIACILVLGSGRQVQLLLGLRSINSSYGDCSMQSL